MKEPEKVRISSFIEHLAKVVKRHGDLEVCANDGWELMEVYDVKSIFEVGKDCDGKKVAYVRIP